MSLFFHVDLNSPYTNSYNTEKWSSPTEFTFVLSRSYQENRRTMAFLV